MATTMWHCTFNEALKREPDLEEWGRLEAYVIWKERHQQELRNEAQGIKAETIGPNFAPPPLGPLPPDDDAFDLLGEDDDAP